MMIWSRSGSSPSCSPPSGTRSVWVLRLPHQEPPHGVRLRHCARDPPRAQCRRGHLRARQPVQAGPAAGDRELRCRRRTRRNHRCVPHDRQCHEGCCCCDLCCYLARPALCVFLVICVWEMYADSLLFEDAYFIVERYVDQLDDEEHEKHPRCRHAADCRPDRRPDGDDLRCFPAATVRVHRTRPGHGHATRRS